MSATYEPQQRAAGWWANLYPTAKEASGTFVSSLQPIRTEFLRNGTNSERSQKEASRRARAKVRRYCAANKLNRFGTLTYEGEGCHDPVQLRKDLGDFFKKLKSALGDDLPYVWVPEWHKTNHGLHAHFAVARYIKRAVIQESWNKGFVHIKLLSDLPVGTNTLDESRVAAGYLSKYISKSFLDNRRVVGLHRYDIAQGFTPEKERIYGVSRLELVENLIEHVGKEPSYFWTSNQEQVWEAPPAIWMSWN